ncbi:MAG TPA: hypothetical protein VFI86_00705, partial [Burkholderiales bacterium]|nr:hypothetical protein [Burkholderiales bacterium]
MKYWTEARGDHLYAALAGRETGDEMREFLLAVQAACRAAACPRILLSVRASRPVFKPEDYGLGGQTRGYLSEIVTPACRVALLGDTAELNAAHEYIELCARQQNINVRAFRDEAAALRWLRSSGSSGTEPELRQSANRGSSGSVPELRYSFTRTVVQGAPLEPGVFALWEGDELVYYGRALRLREALLECLGRHAATHYSWE